MSQKCSQCKKNLAIDCFKPTRNGGYTKSCLICLEKAKELRERSKCEHGKHNGHCRECHPNSFCIHDKLKTRCKKCGGKSICIHDKRRDHCKLCSPQSFCIHGSQKALCTRCGGASVCEHQRVRSQCKECGGGSICEHGKLRCVCVKCDGGRICPHKKNKANCNICDPHTYLAKNVRTQMWAALKRNKTKCTVDYLGCDIDTYRKYLEEQFTDGMSWENYGEWHIDHIIPLQYDNPSLEEVMNRLHYTNTQPMWARENISKNNRYIG